MRTFTKKLPLGMATDFMRSTMRYKSVKSTLFYILANKVDFCNDIDLFNTYSSEYDEAYREYKEFENQIQDYIVPLFGTNNLNWEADLFYFALRVNVEDMPDDKDLSIILSEKFIEIEPGTKVAFREKYLKHQDALVNAYPELFKYEAEDGIIKNKRPLALTFQVTDDCNLCCTYCYQTNKDHHVMSHEMADKATDFILFETEKTSSYARIEDYPTLTLEIIGGEGMLYPELTDYIIKQFMTKMINTNHPWLRFFQVHVGTNGVNYFQPNVFSVYEKWRDIICVSITVDGDKKLHDKCRLFHDGSGSYDLAHKALLYELEHNHAPSTKITLAPDNIPYIKDAIIKLIEEGFPHIWFNAIFEHEWTGQEAAEYLESLKGIADYMIDNDLYNHYDVSVLNIENSYKPLENADQNWCGGDGSMLTIDFKGDAYNCLRYMESSLNDEQPPLIIGNVFDGIGASECSKNNINCMRCITRRSQSTDECYYCPIAAGCAWCSAYNYQVYGTPDKRNINICNIHKANALASAYFFNTIYKKEGSEERVDLALAGAEFFKDIINPEEFEKVINL